MPPELILLGTIGAPHGVRGEVRIRSFAADPLALGSYGPLLAEDGRRFEIERLRVSGKSLVAKLRGVEDRETAERLNGVGLHAERDALPPADEGEFYHADLIGLAAASEAGVELGTVIAVHDFGAGDILEITPQRGASLLVPFTRAAVPIVDIARKRLVVIPPVEAEVDPEQAKRENQTP